MRPVDDLTLTLRRRCVMLPNEIIAYIVRQFAYNALRIRNLLTYYEPIAGDLTTASARIGEFQRVLNEDSQRRMRHIQAFGNNVPWDNRLKRRMLLKWNREQRDTLSHARRQVVQLRRELNNL